VECVCVLCETMARDGNEKREESGKGEVGVGQNAERLPAVACFRTPAPAPSNQMRFLPFVGLLACMLAPSVQGELN